MRATTNSKKIFLANILLAICLSLIGCASLSNNKESLPSNLDQWIVTTTHVYHVTTNGVSNEGIFKPWYKFSRTNNNANNKHLKFMIGDRKHNRIYFVVGNFYNQNYRLYYINLNDATNKPTFLTNANIKNVWLRDDRLYFTSTNQKNNQYIDISYITLNGNNAFKSNTALQIKHKFSNNHALSPNGEILAFTVNDELWIVELRSQKERFLKEFFRIKEIEWASNHELFCGSNKEFTILDINTLKEQSYSIKSPRPILQLYGVRYNPIKNSLTSNGKYMLVKMGYGGTLVYDLLLFDIKRKQLTRILDDESYKTYTWLPNNSGLLMLDNARPDFAISKQSISYFSLGNNTHSQLGKIIPRAYSWILMPKIDKKLLLPDVPLYNDRDLRNWKN